ncbi:MAG: endonuclease/exonuclease/phosphatase family protein [Burkholderiales bacterium]
MQPASIQQKIAKRFIALTVLLIIATIFAVLAKLHWFLELFSHFTPHYFVLSLFCLLGLVLLRAWRWAALACLLALWNGYPVARVFLQDDAPPAASVRPFTVFHFNVGLHHEQPARIVSYLQRRADAVDVVVLLEATDEFGAVLDALKSSFPYQIRHLEDSPFGIALASKHVIDFGVISNEPSRLYPHIEAHIKLPGRNAPLALYALHAPPPISGEMAEARNAKFTHIARKAATQAQATPVVVGDFNLTPWSPYFQQFITDSGLRDARAPRRFDHTWPVTFDNANIGLAIDHTFAHPSLPMVKRTIGPDLGSDHLPVTVIFNY